MGAIFRVSEIPSAGFWCIYFLPSPEQILNVMIRLSLALLGSSLSPSAQIDSISQYYILA